MIFLDQIKRLYPDLENELYHEIAEHSTIREFEAGRPILNFGQPVRSSMLILEGTVKLYQRDDEGDEFFIYYLDPGNACAISLVCSQQAEINQVAAQAVSDVVVLSIPLEKMDEWMFKYRTWYSFVIRTYRNRYNELLKTINEIAFKNMDERLEFYLKKQVKQFGTTIKMTHQEIANDLNSSREVISRLMKKMEKDGWLKIHRNSVEWIVN